MSRGYFAVGVYSPKTAANIGTLWRSAYLYNAAFVFTVGARYQRQASDTPNTPLHTPLFHFNSMQDLLMHLPHQAPIVGVELTPDATPLPKFGHPERALYLLGAEDHGLPDEVLALCHTTVVIPSLEPQSMNVSTAGTVVLYDRYVKGTIVDKSLAV